MHYQTHVYKFLIVMYNLQLLFCDENANKYKQIDEYYERL